MPKYYIGTSGWNYKHWKDIFYPKGLSSNKWLEHYVKFFNAVELNVTFYRLVKADTFKNWYKRTPKNFCFVAKGSRFITHIKRLALHEDSINLFIDNAIELREKLAAILWQLPPSFKKDVSRLERFFKLLQKTKMRHVFEFRNQTWFDKEVYALLKRFNACLCIAHSGRFPCVKEITSDFLYLRFHGGQSLYGSDYSDKELKQWAGLVKDFESRPKSCEKKKRKYIFAFFNNDACGFAVKNAMRFRQLLEQ